MERPGPGDNGPKDVSLTDCSIYGIIDIVAADEGSSDIALFRCPTAMPPEGSTRAGILPKPRKGKSIGRGPIRTTNLPERCNTVKKGAYQLLSILHDHCQIYYRRVFLAP
ncbi:hypothetical protein T265_09056 [Opisthorchis viverrini]|uniref:Uncharacterized protein n=1 Tax=Opisthorchis viverrini TaxID=6198 RepID=A0A074Z711_OPIVI|nr:hypothetical protein T265_09056 [Opisthorchis viverrini]KER22976.1 hypothetical protein T265_09056 [Opisthorchis viverrini]